MEENEIRDLLFDIFRKTFDYTLPVTDDLSAERVEKWNSLTHTVFIVEIESRFGITLSLREVFQFRNLGDVVVAIKKHKR
jgi:acyl carrier protein